MSANEARKPRVRLSTEKWNVILNLLEKAAARQRADILKRAYLSDLADHIRNQLDGDF